MGGAGKEGQSLMIKTTDQVAVFELSKSTTEWLDKEKQRVMEWPGQSSDLDPIEMLWGDLKLAVHARHASNIAQLKKFCMEDWADISLECCQRLVDCCSWCLHEIVSAKWCNTTKNNTFFAE